MTFKTPIPRGTCGGSPLASLCALACCRIACRAPRQRRPRRRGAAAEPTVNKGDTAWMLSATVLVLLMTIPGLALFYGGLVRSKNMLSVLMWVFYSVCIVTMIWVVYGYSLAFTGGSTPSSAASRKVFLSGVTHRLEGRDLLGRREHSRARLRLLPDDLRGDHAGADRRRVRRAHEVLRDGAVPAAVGAASSTSRSPTWSGTGPARTRSTPPPRRSPPRPTAPPRRPRRPSSTRSTPTPA